MKSKQMILLAGLCILLIGGVWVIEMLTNSQGTRISDAGTLKSLIVPEATGSAGEITDASTQTETSEGPVSASDTQLNVELSVIDQMAGVSDPVVDSSLGSLETISDEPIIIVSESYPAAPQHKRPQHKKPRHKRPLSPIDVINEHRKAIHNGFMNRETKLRNRRMQDDDFNTQMDSMLAEYDRQMDRFTPVLNQFKTIQELVKSGQLSEEAGLEAQWRLVVSSDVVNSMFSD